ncbi:MAG: hypothetical protein WCT46_02220 [Candidatus Gracilibacteria bacterium]|jgi:hypothetical protein
MCHPGEGAHGDPQSVMSKTRNPGIRPPITVSPGVTSSRLMAGGKPIDVDAAPLAREASKVSGAASAATTLATVAKPATTTLATTAKPAPKAPEAPTYEAFRPVIAFLAGVPKNADVVARLAVGHGFFDKAILLQKIPVGGIRDEGLVSFCKMVGYTADIPTPIDTKARAEIEGLIFVDINVAVRDFILDEAVKAQAAREEVALAAQQEQQRLMFVALDNVNGLSDEELIVVIEGHEIDFAAVVLDSPEDVHQSPCLEILLQAGGYNPDVWTCDDSFVAKVTPILVRCAGVAKVVLDREREEVVSGILGFLAGDLDKVGYARANGAVLALFDSSMFECNEGYRVDAVDFTLRGLGYTGDSVVIDDPRVSEVVGRLMVELRVLSAEVKIIDALSGFFGSEIPDAQLRRVASEHPDEIIGFDTTGGDADRVDAVRKLAGWFNFPLGDVTDLSLSGVRNVEVCVDLLVGTVDAIENEKKLEGKANAVRDQLGAVSDDDREVLAGLHEERLIDIAEGSNQIEDCFSFVKEADVSEALIGFTDTSNVDVREFFRDLLQRARNIKAAREKAEKMQVIVGQLDAVTEVDRDRLAGEYQKGLMLLTEERLGSDAGEGFEFVMSSAAIDRELRTNSFRTEGLVIGAVKRLVGDLHNRAVAKNAEGKDAKVEEIRAGIVAARGWLPSIAGSYADELKSFDQAGFTSHPDAGVDLFMSMAAMDSGWRDDILGSSESLDLVRDTLIDLKKTSEKSSVVEGVSAPVVPEREGKRRIVRGVPGTLPDVIDSTADRVARAVGGPRREVASNPTRIEALDFKKLNIINDIMARMGRIKRKSGKADSGWGMNVTKACDEVLLLLSGRGFGIKHGIAHNASTSIKQAYIASLFAGQPGFRGLPDSLTLDYRTGEPLLAYQPLVPGEVVK